MSKLESSAEYLHGWSDGKTAGLLMMTVASRTEAFAAIRRAVEIARNADDMAEMWRNRGDDALAILDNVAANQIRVTVRACIKSPRQGEHEIDDEQRAKIRALFRPGKRPHVPDAEDRLAAFAAIRRAAASAREWDALGDHLGAEYAYKIAEEIRNSIRAAIGSEKQS